MAKSGLYGKNGKFNDAEKKQLAEWIGCKVSDFRLIYQASEQGCVGTKFHELCNDQGPTVSIAYTSNGYAFGGYASVSWNNSGGWVSDPKSFLFRMRESNNPAFMKYTGSNQFVLQHPSSGPSFGNNSNGNQIQLFNGQIFKDGNGYFKLNYAITNSGSNYNYGYNMQGHHVPHLCGNDGNFTDVEVYSLQGAEFILLPEDKPWRDVGIEWESSGLETLKAELSEFSIPEGLRMDKVNALLVGQVGSGKSSFCNTINSVFKGHVASRATAGSTEHSLTTKYRMYELRSSRRGKPLPLRLCDMMGLEEEQNVDTLGFPYLLDGYVQDRYQFNTSAPITPENAAFRKDPKLKDKIHVVVLLVDGATASVMPSGILEKIKTLRLHVNQRLIPMVALLTKVDKIDPQVEEDLTCVYRSASVQQAVEEFADKVGLPVCNVLPMKNYHKETELKTSVNILALTAVRQILRLADDYIEEQLDLLGVEPAATALGESSGEEQGF